MGFLSSASNKERLVALFDVGSGSVGGAIARIPKDRNVIPIIIYSARTDIAFHNELKFDVFLTDMKNALSATAEKLSKARMGSVDEIVCTLSSPWYLSETRLLKMSRERPFTFTNRLADELLQKEVALLADLYQKKYGGVESIAEVIEHHVVGVSLNGYPVAEPVGKKSKSVEMDMIISLSPKLCLDTMRDALSRAFHHTPITFSSFTVASYLAVRDKYVSPDSYLLLDVGGEVTDVSVVSKGILRASLSFPFGTNTFFKYLCCNLSIELRDALELFTLYTTGTLEENRKQKLEEVLTLLENSWGQSLRGCIAALPHTIHLPNTVFLTALPLTRKWFSDVICEEEYIQSLVADHRCTIVTLDGPDFLNMCKVNAGACDPFLMIEAIAVTRKIHT